MKGTLIEAVPNFSDGCREEVINAVVTAAASVTGVRLLDLHSDPDHNRSVLTLAGEPDGISDALFAATSTAMELIDLSVHRGEHPRIGAMDVIPLIPLSGTDLARCTEVAVELGGRIARELEIPVFLYGEAARCPEFRNLAYIRRGGLERLVERMTKGVLRPDLGPPRPHPTAGAVAIGARGPLIAFNVNLATDDLEAARFIARKVRGSSGGLPNVKALGIRLGRRGLVQVSMNLEDFRQTPVHAAYHAVLNEARKMGVEVAGYELVGLVPQEAIPDRNEEHPELYEFFKEGRILEQRLAEDTHDYRHSDRPRN